MQTRLLKAAEVAQALGVSRTHAFLLMRSGAIEVIRFGKSVRVTETALEQFICQNTRKVSNPKLDELDNH
ncbi:MAG: helix-turn-helix domain-containing protein [Anaerolineaceae bacterium]|nr:helix-turn-helix domain-containing protein [Anaerolineaceae bacterium]